MEPFHQPFLSFIRWNLGYHGAFSRTFLSYNGTKAITEPFHESFLHRMELRLSPSLFTNFSFAKWNLGFNGAFSRTFLSYDGTQAITEPFHRLFFLRMELHKTHNLGEDSFHIYHKEYLHRIRLVKNQVELHILSQLQ
jgi:hypothetical protein